MPTFEPSFKLRFKLYWLLTDGLPLWICLRVGEAVHTPGAGAGAGGGACTWNINIQGPGPGDGARQ